MVEQPRPGLAKNVGWRLDYHLATPGIAKHAKAEYIHLETRSPTTRRW